MLPHALEISWKMLPGISPIAKHWSAWCGQSRTEFCRWGPHQNWRAPSPIIKWPGASPVKFSGGCKCAVWRGHRPNLMSHPQSECTQSSLLHPQVGCQKDWRPLRPWTRLPIKSTLQRREPWEEKQTVDPNTHPMTWMRDRQNSYSDEMISFWPLLRPLTDGGGMATRCLVCRLLSTWQWSSATHTASCPPAPSNMEIGQLLPLDKEGKKEDLWMEA